MSQKNKLALFFTTGVSLETWINVGNFDREKRIYEEHLKQKNFSKIYWFTYGTKDFELAERLKAEKRLHKNIVVKAMPRVFSFSGGRLLYSFLLPFVHTKSLKKIDICKSNQMSGAWTAMIAAKFFKKPLWVRTGYTWSLFAKQQKKSPAKLRAIDLVERLVYKSASLSSVTSQADKNHIKKKYGIDPSSIFLVSNYIDTKLFKNEKRERKHNVIVTVTRLATQKNLENLVRALPGSDLSLDLYYGGGDLREQLEEIVKDVGANVKFLGSVKNSELPAILNSYKYFVLPSLYEGMPKTLLEAMACGCVCGGTKVPGIQEVIEDGEGGVLVSGTDVSSLGRLLEKIQKVEFDKVSNQAVKKIESLYSLQTILEREKKIVTKLLQQK